MKHNDMQVGNCAQITYAQSLIGGAPMLEIAVCDDNGKDLDTITEKLHEICAEMREEYHVSVFRSPAGLLEGNIKIDIGILDIVMPGCNGIDLGKKLKEKFGDIALIYTTSYEDYCRQAINKVHAFSFLVKPIDKEELKEQLAACRQRTKGHGQERELTFENVRNSSGDIIPVVQIKVKDILYCEYMKAQREISIVSAHEVYFYSAVFQKLSEQLENWNFAVNRRGSIVNLSHIKRLKGYTIYLDNGEELLLTQKRVSDFKEKMNRYFHEK